VASDSFKNTTIAFLLFGLFAVLIVTAIYEMGFSYGVSDEKMQEATQGALAIDEQEQELLTADQDTENFRERFESGDVDDVDDPSGLFSVITDMVSMITTPFSLLSRVLINLLHLPSIFINVVLGLLSISVFLAIWKIMRAGA